MEKKRVRPDQILVISFTNKAVSELREKINRDLKIKCPVATFHKTGYAILKRQGKGGKFYLIGQTMEKIMKEICRENPKSSILILGRYGFDTYNLGKSADFIYLEDKGTIVSKTFKGFEFEYMTVHRSKGLGFDNVIIINAIDHAYGFPSKIQDDPVLKNTS